MTYRIFALSFLSAVLLLISGCSTQKQLTGSVNPDNWVLMATADDVDILVDTTSIRREGATIFAIEKRIYLTSERKLREIDKIRKEYTKMGKPEKANRWNDLSYSIHYSEYDCVNSRLRVLWVEDYDSTGKRIVRTTPAKGKERWVNVGEETVGDYTFFYICDFGN